MFEVEWVPAVKVDGFFVDEHERAGEIDFANDIWRAGDVDDHEIVAGDGTQADGIGGGGFLRPGGGFFRGMEKNSIRGAGGKDGDEATAPICGLGEGGMLRRASWWGY